MRKLLFYFVFILTSSRLFAQAPADKRLAGLDTFARTVLRDWHAAGVSIAVVEKGKVIYAGGFGYRDLDKRLPVTETTLFAIGSCTKAFTASILGMLQQEGKLDIDKPVRNYLPQLKFQNEYTNDHATLRDMMCHRTGLPRHDASWYGSGASRAELLERIQYLEPTAELRARWQYNNFMFLAQGMVIEALTGKSWEVNMRERILQPLGMDNTDLSVVDLEKSADRSLAYATNDSVIKAIPYRNIDAVGPAGSVNSCARDMAKWLITWINNGKYNGKEIIPSSFRNDAITQQMATGGGLPSAETPDIHFSGYGLAWGMSSYRGHYRVEHGGGIDGFISSTGFYPSDSIGIFVVSNQGQPVSAIRNFIADRMLKLPLRNWNKFFLDAAAKAKKAASTVVKNDSLDHQFHTTPSHPLSDYAGSYSNPGYGRIEITLKDTSLLGSYNNYKVRLEHFHYDQFRGFVIDDPSPDQGDGIRFRFITNEKGNINVVAIPLEGEVKDIEFTRETKMGKEDLEKFVGDYDLGSGVNARFYIKGEKTLYAFIEGQPEYELAPTGKNTFELKTLKGYSVAFDADEKGDIQAVRFIQPNGIFKATKKKKP